jgi:hypothetical protein
MLALVVIWIAGLQELLSLDVVVCMQIDSSILFHHGFLLSGCEYQFRLSTILLLYCPVEEPSR